MQRSILAGALLAALTFGAPAAHAAILISATPGPQAPVVPGGLLDDFDGPTPAGFVYSGSYDIQSGTIVNVNAQPWLDTTNYFFAPRAPAFGGNATIDFSGALGSNGVSSIDFYWGSVDYWNTLTILDRSGNPLLVVPGNTFPPANGNQFSAGTNLNIHIVATGLDRGQVGGLNLGTTQPAFEIEGLNIITGSVPEISTWAMMILGFFGTGAVIRQQRKMLQA